MVHGDDSGLVLPPRIAPTQVMVIPIQQHKEGVLERAESLKKELSEVCRVKLDDSEKSPGWKFSEQTTGGNESGTGFGGGKSETYRRMAGSSTTVGCGKI